MGETSEALAFPYREAKEAVAQADMTHMDETGWKENGKRYWLWLAEIKPTTVFMVSCSRGRQALKEFIGESFAGFLPSDRWGAYNMVNPSQRQFCWAHRKRDFKRSPSARLGTDPWEHGDLKTQVSHQVTEDNYLFLL